VKAVRFTGYLPLDRTGLVAISRWRAVATSIWWRSIWA